MNLPLNCASLRNAFEVWSEIKHQGTKSLRHKKNQGNFVSLWLGVFVFGWPMTLEIQKRLLKLALPPSCDSYFIRFFCQRQGARDWQNSLHPLDSCRSSVNQNGYQSLLFKLSIEKTCEDFCAVSHVFDFYILHIRVRCSFRPRAKRHRGGICEVTYPRAIQPRAHR